MATVDNMLSKALRLLEGKALAIRLRLKSQEKADSEAKALVGNVLQVKAGSSTRIFLEQAVKSIEEISHAPEDRRERARQSAIKAVTTAKLALIPEAAHEILKKN